MPSDLSGKVQGVQETRTWQAWLIWPLRLLLGATFIWASWHKIAAPDQFARILYGYGVFPMSLINLLAIWVPFVELLSGLCLILGRPGSLPGRSGLTLINLMLVSFILLIGFNLIRGHEFDCGCFSFAESTLDAKTEAIRLLFRDLALLGAGGWLWTICRKREGSGRVNQPEP